MGHPRLVALLAASAEALAPLRDVACTLFETAGRPPVLHEATGGGAALALIHAAGVRPPLDVARLPDGALLAINGAVFALDGQAVRPDATAATLDALWRREGPASLARMNGKASVIRWSPSDGGLTLARDRFGFGQLYYTRIGGVLAVASDLPTLVDLGADHEIDSRAIDALLGHGFTPAPWTPLRAVAKIPPAHAVHLRLDGEDSPQRHTVLQAGPHETVSEGALNPRIEATLCAAIARRMAPVGPTGLLLSGGVDSALLLALLRRRLDCDVAAFTFHYTDYEGAFNEGGVAADLARHFGARHELISVSPGDIADNLPGIIRTYGEPITYGLHSAMLPRIAGHGLTHVLSGGGSDDFDIDRSGLLGIWLSRLPAWMRASMLNGLGGLGRLSPALAQRSYVYRWADRHGLPTVFYPPQASDEERVSLFRDQAGVADGQAQAIARHRAAVAEMAGESAIDAWRLLSTQTFSADCMNTWVTAWSRATGLVIADPYFDPDVVALMLRVSADGFGKQRLRRFAASLMPPRNAHAPKIPQTIPVGTWLAGPWRDLMHDHLTAARVGDLFDMAAVRSLIQAHERGDRRRTWLLWSLLSVSAWREAVLTPRPKALRSPARPVLAGSD